MSVITTTQTQIAGLCFLATQRSIQSTYGLAEISKDREKIHELWEPIVKAWFTEGEDDPPITVIKFTPETGYYWDTKHGNLVAFAKMSVGAAIGKTLDDTIEGNLNP